MKILFVGFGNMGCRHAQSLIDSKAEHTYLVLEPSLTIFTENLSKIGATEKQFTRIENINDLPNNIDFAVVATSSSPRYDIVKTLIYKGIKFFLLEKIVFQSESQFDKIIELLHQSGSLAYCNFVNRYYPNYIDIKESIMKEHPLTMVVSGGDFGLGCNALHYIDLFEYFTGRSARVTKHSLRVNSNGNRRGGIYKELLGQIVLTTEINDTLIISAEPARIGGNEITIKQEGTFDILNEETKKHIHFSEVEPLSQKDFKILYTSQLTSRLINDIMNGITLLPNVNQVKSCHTEFFKAANLAFGLAITELCPLT